MKMEESNSANFFQLGSAPAAWNCTGQLREDTQLYPPCASLLVQQVDGNPGDAEKS